MRYFCPIPPINHLELMTLGKGSTVMGLAQLVLRHPQYAMFLRTLRQRNHTIILDQGAAENEQVTYDEFNQAIERVRPHIVIFPDVLFNARQTLQAMSNYYTQTVHTEKFLGVPQGATAEEWLECYKVMLSDDRVHIIGLSKIAIPHCFGEEDIAIARNQAVRLLQSEGLLLKPIHLLGMGAPRELDAYQDIEAIQGIDSCYPIWAGMNNLQFGRDEFQRFKNDPMYFLHHISEPQYFNALANIETVNGWI